MPVQILNDTRLALGFMAGRVRKSGHQLTAIVKGVFTLSHAKVAAAFDRPFLSGEAHWDDDIEASPRYATDFPPFKPRADVLVTGTCHARGAKQAMVRVGLRFGPHGSPSIDKGLVVFGERRFVEQSFGRAEISEIIPFQSLPLRYENAFGGLGSAANPTGKGFASDAPSGARPLPNIELPSALIRSPKDSPSPAGLGPIDQRWSLRSSKMGTYDQDWLRDRWPYFPDDFDWTYFNAAPADQQIAYPRGDEGFAIEGMHPEHARFEAQLPGVRPRCFIRKSNTMEPLIEEVVLNLDTVTIDLEEARLTCVWRGLAEVLSREYEEVDKALLVTESLAEPARPGDHYRAPRWWTAQAPSQEELGAAEEAAARGAGDVVQAPPSAKRADKAVDPDEVAALDEARADLVKAGVDPAILDRLKGVTRASVFTEILVAAMPQPAEEEDVKKAGEEASTSAAEAPTEGDDAEAEKKREKAELDTMRTELTEANADPALLRKLEGVESKVDFLAIVVGALPEPRSPAESDDRRALLETIAKMKQAEDTAALAGEAKIRSVRGERLTRDEVLALVATGHSLAEANLTELDLSDADLPGVNLSGALLDGAKLVRTNLSGADLTGAALRGADLTSALLADAVGQDASFEGATLRGANLSRANLARAKLEAAVLEHAILSEADLSGAKLVNAHLEEASLAGAQLDEADLSGATLRGANAPKATLRQAMLAGAVLDDAILDGAVFHGCAMNGARFSNASLHEAHFDGASGSDVTFAGATMTNVRAGGARFVGGRFTRVSADGSNWSGAELTGADFEGASLEGANFSGANLSTASFHLARLMQANLSKATLASAKVTKTNLFQARLGAADLTGADCRSSNLFECELFEAITIRTRFERANLKRTRLADRSVG